MRHSVLLVATLLALACRPSAAPPGAPAPDRAPLRFLLVNDVYVPDTLRDGSGGVARVAWLRDSLERTGSVVFVLAGDVLSPSLLSKWYAGRQMVDVFNAASLDYATFGNHEFELDRDTLITRIAQSRFRWLSANCTLADGAPFPGVASWDTLRMNGVRVGIFGTTLQGSYRSYVRCTDPDSATARAIDELERAGAEVIVGLTHQNVSADSALLAREPRIDLILGGHEHDRHLLSVGGRLVAKADANARSAQLVTLTPDGNDWRPQPRLFEMTRTGAMDAAAARTARAWSDTLVRRLGPPRVIATTSQPIDARDVLSRSEETLLGNLVTDALRLGTGADVALLNAGTMRLDDVIDAGPVTSYQLESIFLFADETRIVTFRLTGARLRELLEHGVSERNHGRGGFLQVSGVRFTYSLARPSGSRLVGDLRRPDGRAIAATDTLGVSFGVYPSCEGGDGYQIPEAAAACAGWRTAPRAVDLLISHLETRLNGRVEVPEGRRIVKN
jgi:2',3'-cyclic-nucleotide 2'-phosphodiesterase (5'-nucleotidase family)